MHNKDISPGTPLFIVLPCIVILAISFDLLHIKNKNTRKTSSLLANSYTEQSCSIWPTTAQKSFLKAGLRSQTDVPSSPRFKELMEAKFGLCQFLCFLSSSSFFFYVFFSVVINLLCVVIVTMDKGRQQRTRTMLYKKRWKSPH